MQQIRTRHIGLWIRPLSSCQQPIEQSINKALSVEAKIVLYIFAFDHRSLNLLSEYCMLSLSLSSFIGSLLDIGPSLGSVVVFFSYYTGLIRCIFLLVAVLLSLLVQSVLTTKELLVDQIFQLKNKLSFNLIPNQAESPLPLDLTSLCCVLGGIHEVQVAPVFKVKQFSSWLCSSTVITTLQISVSPQIASRTL